MRLFFKLIGLTAATVLVGVIAVNLSLGVISASGAYRVAQEQTGSMTPTIPVGGLVIYRPAVADTLHRGEVISFRRPGVLLTVTHRIVSLHRSGRVIDAITRGDANPVRDRQIVTFGAHETVWHVVRILPAWAGGIITALGKRGIYLAAGLLPLLLLLPWIESLFAPGVYRGDREAGALQRLPQQGKGIMQRRLIAWLLGLGALSVAGLAQTTSTYSLAFSRVEVAYTAPLLTVGTATVKSSDAHSYSVTGIAPGGSADYLLDLRGDGSNPPDIASSVTTSSSTLLDTDATDGLHVEIDDCSTLWQQSANGSAATCYGTQTTVVTSAALASSNTANPTLTSSGLAALSAKGVDHLRIDFTVPAAAPASYSSLTSTPTVTIWGLQAPGAPTALKATAGESNILVSWSAPESSGNSTVTGYTATASPSSQTCTTAAAASCTISGLTDGETQSVTVKATNAAGSGAASTAASATPYPSILTGTGAVLWLDGADSTTLFQNTAMTTPVTAAGQSVAAWKDKSGKGNNVTAPGTAPVANTEVFAGKTAVTFSAGAYLSRATGWPESSDYTELAVYHPTSNCVGNILSGTGVHAWFLNDGAGLTIYQGGSSLGAAKGAAAGSTYVGSATFQTSSLAASVDVNATTPVTGALTVQDTGDSAIQVGAFDGENGLCGQVAEVVVLSRLLSAAERRVVEDYLAHKWAITIAPEPPAAPTATAATQSAGVSWAASTWNGGSAVTGYTATASPGGSNCTTTTTSCTVTGLTAGTPYTFTVAATNAAGTSNASGASNSITPTASLPGAPTGAADTPESGKLLVGWSAPVSNGGAAITAYTATASPGSVSCTTTGATSCTISPLTNGTAYSVTVTATNSAGTGPASNTATGTPGGSARTPGAPAAVTLTPGEASIAVGWTAPPVTGGAAITAYTATASPSGKTCASSGATSCTISSLTDGEAQSVTVTATNSAGVGPASNPSAATPYPTLLTGTGAVLWLDGADSATLFQNTAETVPVTAAGQPVAAWKDRSGKGNDLLAPAGTALSNTATFAGLTSVTVGSGSYLARSSGFPTSSDYTEFAVYHSTSNCTGNILSGESTRAWYINGGAGLTLYHNGSQLESGLGGAANSSFLGSATFKTSSLAASIDVDAISPSEGTLSAQDNSDAAIELGAFGGGNSFCGQIAEVAVLSRVLAQTERRTVEDYLAHKWGITVTPDPPAAPTATAPKEGSGEAKVSWPASAWSGGSAITKYKVTASVGTHTCETSSTSCTLTGLTSKTATTFTVAAVNAIGTSAASGASNSVQP